MLRSLSSAISGLRNYQLKLDVVGNNIANVNTVGYKYSTARFQDIFSQTIRGATAPLAGRGGINPIQVGLGMTLSSVDTVHTQGALTSTGRETDLAIEGRGFFVVSDGVRVYYTRDGSFVRDAYGMLVNSGGFRLMGWTIPEGEELDLSRPLTHIHIPLGEEMVAKATEKIVFSGNLNSGEEGVYAYEAYVYDSLGNRHTLTIEFEREAEPNQWNYTVYYKGEEVHAGTLEFTPSGRFIIPDIPDGGDDPHAFTIESDNLETGAEELKITLNFKDITQLAYPSNAFVREQDGFPPGELAAFNIESTGVITGTYTNGMVRPLAQIAMASFANPEGLLKLGSNLYDVSSNSGAPRIGLPGEEGRGLVQSRALEMSNVDLAGEFTEMITASRAFQANTRMISTSDEVLQELINVKR